MIQKVDLTHFNAFNNKVEQFNRGMRVALFLVALLVNRISNAQVNHGMFMSFDFSAATALANPATFPTYYTNGAVDTTGVIIKRGTGTITFADTAKRDGAYGFRGIYSSNETNALAGQDFVEFFVRPAAGFEFRMDSLIIRWKYSHPSGQVNFIVRSSADGFTTTMAKINAVANATGYGNNVTKFVFSKPFYATDTFTLRLYLWDQTTIGATSRSFYFSDGFTNSSYAHDIALWGRTSPIIPQIQAFDFSTATGNESTFPLYNASNTFIDSTGVIVSRGAGLTPPSVVAGSYAGASLSAASLSDAINANDYFQFSIKPKSGYEFDVDRLTIRYFSTATTGPNAIAIRTSIDNFSSNAVLDTLVRGAFIKQNLTPSISLASDTPIICRIYIWGATNESAEFRFTDGTSPSSLNGDLVLYGNFSTSNIPTAVLSVLGDTATCLGGGISLRVTTSGGTAPFTVWLRDNLGEMKSYTQWGADTTFTVYPQSDRSYFLDSVKDIMGHNASSLSGIVTVTVSNSPLAIDPGVYNRSLEHLDGLSLTYANGTLCRSLVKISDNVGGQSLDSTVVQVEVYATSPNNSTQRFFIPRRTKIVPAHNANATVTLLLTPSDFTSFNTHANYQRKMPVDASDTVDILNRIQVVRTNQSNETDNLTILTPSSVIWNSNLNRWELSVLIQDNQLEGHYYITSPFTSLKKVNTISHLAISPQPGANGATVMVSWDSVPNVTQYRYRFRVAGTTTWNVSTQSGTSRTQTNLMFNTTYEVQLRVFENQTTQGEYSATYTFTTPPAPSPLPVCISPNAQPVGVTANGATLTWANVNHAQHYFIQIRPKNTLAWGGSSSNSNTISFNSLSPNTTYEFRIRSHCAPGVTASATSNFSTVDTFRTLNLMPCALPNAIHVSNVSMTNASLRWTQVPTATSYFIQIRLKNAVSWGGRTLEDTLTVFNNLLPASTYEYRIRTVCMNGNAQPMNSSFSAIGEFTTTASPSLQACSVPDNIVASPTGTSVAITWNNTPSDSLYFIQIKPLHAHNWGGSTISLNYRSYSNLTPNTSYQVRIRTTCKSGTTHNNRSEFSDTVLFLTTGLANKFDAVSTEMFTVFPNPIQDWLTIQWNSNDEVPVHILIRDLNGRILRSKIENPSLGDNISQFDFSDFTYGVYVLNLVRGDQVLYTHKIIKL